MANVRFRFGDGLHSTSHQREPLCIRFAGGRCKGGHFHTFSNQPSEDTSERMKPFNFGYSMKNIPICSDTEYLDLFVARVSQFVWNFRWYAWHHLCPEATSSDKECYGLKSRRTPPPYSAKNYGKHWELLKSFEAKICELARNIRFGPCSNDLQKNLLPTGVFTWAE